MTKKYSVEFYAFDTDDFQMRLLGSNVKINILQYLLLTNNPTYQEYLNDIKFHIDNWIYFKLK